MRINIFVVLCIYLVTSSCQNEKKSKYQKGLETEAASVVDAASLKAVDFKDKLDELLTLEIAAQVSGLPAAKAEKDHSKFSSLESISYEWESERTKAIEISKGIPLQIPIPNSIELSWVKNNSLADFKHSYHNPTPEELKRAEKAMDKKMNELEADGKATKDQTSTASGIAKNSISKFSVEEVPNLGTYSVFVNSGIMGAKLRDLNVFYRGISFQITADLSDDAAYNDKKAVETARLIIEKLK
jgi:hypothetical protein